MVEYNLAKINVEGSSPFFRFYFIYGPKGSIWYFHFLVGNNIRIDVLNLNNVIID